MSDRLTADDLTPPVLVRFWAKVEKRGPTDCWPWIGGRFSRGYGNFWAGGRARGAHRVSHVISTGVDPGDLFVCHRCDNPPCVNPAHLFVGTVADNNADKAAKGRSVPQVGERNNSAKLTTAQVAEIRGMQHGELPQASIAHMYGVSISTVSMIWSGRRWSSEDAA